MATSQAQLTFTADDYLTLERSSEERHEFVDGQISAMAGESPDHGTICSNLTIAIGSQLKGTPCQVWSKDTKVRSGPLPQAKWRTKGLFSYPDLVVACGKGKYLDEHRDVLLNPHVIIEVLSPATEAFDRGEKFLRYQSWLPTLSNYLLVSQSSPMVTHHVKRDDGGWSLYFCEGLKESLLIQSINCSLVMADVYDRIEFPAVNKKDEDDSQCSI
ncbi:MAG TPA: Uma2 family endonuclease [Blastocatellia bacterium]